MTRDPRRNAWLDPDPLYVEPEPVRPVERSGNVIVWLAAGLLIGAVAAVILAAIATSRSAPDPAQSGTPHGSQVHPEITGTVAVPAGGVPSSPAALSGSASEGSSDLTTSTPATISAGTRQGVITHNDDATSRSYLALPCQRNGVHCRLLVRICGPADCVELRQTDYGPSQRLHPDRIADVHPATFERLCGCPASRGVTVGTWTAITHIPLPETDAAP